MVWADGTRGYLVKADFDWPTIEWVKVPVDINTGVPSGAAIRMRHFRDCDHWYRDANGGFIGPEPYLASKEQMRELLPCKDCQGRAKRERHPSTGSWSSTTSDSADVQAAPSPIAVDVAPTDRSGQTQFRREQAYLRSHLLKGRDFAPCDVCGRDLPAPLLVAAHIVPRSQLSDAERLNFGAAAMLACGLGCDALFELGYLVVDGVGVLARGRPTASVALELAVNQLVGSDCPGHDSERASSFSRHRDLHLQAEPSGVIR